MKKICAILLSVLMLVSLCVPAGAFELEAVETVKETTADPAEVTDAALTAVDPLLRPGLNTVNGKTVPEDFESWTKDNPAIVSSKGATARKIENSPADVNGHAADKCFVLERKMSLPKLIRSMSLPHAWKRAEPMHLPLTSTAC